MAEKILVTGATGFIGRRLAEILVEKGCSIRLLVRDVKRLSLGLRSSCEIVIGDLNNKAALIAALDNCQLIYHCAANVKTWDRWEGYYEANVQGLENLLQTAVCDSKVPPRLIHLSTVDVYGFPPHACSETAPLAGGGFFYGKSKILGEKLVQQYAENYNMPYTIVRPCNVIGPRSQFIERIGQELKAGVMLKVGGGHVNAGLVYIDNLVGYLLQLAESQDALGEVYNVRDPYDVSWSYFLKAFRRQIDGKGLVVNLPFSVAQKVASLFEKVYRLLPTGKEPLLHLLLIYMFGRTCGHSSQKIYQACGSGTSLEFTEALERSSRWFLQNQSGQ